MLKIERKKLKVARPNPAVHRGGINAVAIATAGIGFPFSTLVMAMIPTRPPKKQSEHHKCWVKSLPKVLIVRP
ncbi:hypothetical protein ASG01_09420 [Chryseobacterium sp. Leaf180]|nr:hypothetical protein ASG01_09420 [Chryseobacterium sp. Leaf180]